jgi:hypothetical protein
MSTSMKALQKIVDEASPHDLIRLAKLTRKAYCDRVANTKEVLNPAMLRKFDAKIAELEALLN